MAEIDVESDINKVELKRYFHNVLHTSSYHYAIENIMYYAYNIGKSNPSVSIFEAVSAALYTIKTVFEQINNTLS